MNWVEIPSVAINMPLEPSLLNFFCFYCCGNPILRRDNDYLDVSELGAAAGRSCREVGMAPASGSSIMAAEPPGFHTGASGFLAWKCNGAIRCVTSSEMKT